MHPEPLPYSPAGPSIDPNDTTITLRPDPSLQCHVLLVDDDELVREQLTVLLTLAGYSVHPAGSGEEALCVLATTPCQIVLTDWQMPDMDGLALCRCLRLRDNESYIYVLLLTVRGTSEDILRGLAAGADDYVIKGAPAEQILARMEVGKRITRLEHSLRTSNRENRRLSVTDPLTGARNRRYLMKYLPRELERSRRYNHPLALLSCDIDEFKRINDGFGHDAGDEVLRACVERFTSCLRMSSDWIARVGGEEFVIVLPETTVGGASRVATKLLQALSAQPIPTCAGPLAVTVSIGVTGAESADDLAKVSAGDLLRVADRCLYLSKTRGRDQSTAEPAASATPAMSSTAAQATHEIN